MTNDFPVATTNRPYPPPSNVTMVLHRLRTRNLPERINKEYLRDVGVPDGTNARTMFALRFLGLADGDSPTPALRSIATSADEEYKAALSDLLRESYSEVFQAIDPGEDRQDRIVNFFRRYTPGSQRDRMVVFFLGMCREAGIQTLDAPRPRVSRTVVNAKPGRQGLRAPSHTMAADTRPVRTSKNSRRGSDSENGIPPALELLVRSLPPEGTPLPAARLEQWLRMAREALAFTYPSEASAPMNESANDDEAEDDDEA